MSLVPRCPFCDGLEVGNSAPVRERMNSIRCHCDDDEPNLLKDEEALRRRVEEELRWTMQMQRRRAA